MSSGEQQLQADFALVKKLLSDYPCIKLIATTGEPPEQYDIEYHLKGYKAQTDDTVLPANRHQVRITLPFGYPHFPPTAKPLTAIFHPDIDPDAIRIADFWKEHKSLPELIIHIGKMICGTFYSADPFNQRAFDWYEERKSWMPFDILEPHEDDDEWPALIRGSATGVAAAAEQTKPAPAQEEISLDFAGEDTPPPQAAEENGELGDLFGGEFSLAYDLEESPEEPTEAGIALEDLTGLPETDTQMEFEFETPETAGPSMDLTSFQDETPSLDFGLQLETEQPTAELQFADLSGGVQESDFSAGFNLEEELQAVAPESIELGDLAGLEELSPESKTTAAPAEPASPPTPAEDFTMDFGIASSTQLPTAEPSAPEPAADGGILGGISLQLDENQGKKFSSQAGSIRPLIDKKEIFTAKKVLADIPDPSSVPDHEELKLTIDAAISEAEALYIKADLLEQKGDLEKAGLLLDLVANIATDYPGLEFARNRIRESMLASGQKKTGAAAEAEADAGAQQQAAKIKGSPKLKVQVPYKLLGAFLGLAGIVGAGTFLYFRDSASLAKAREEYSKGKQLVEKKEFKEAEKAFTAARTELGTILLQQWGGKKEVGQDIDAIVNTQPFKEGLQGRVQYNGQYVSVEASKAMDQFNRQAGIAEQALKAGKVEQAVAAHEKSLEYAQQAGLKDKIPAIRQTISTLQLQQAMEQARKAEEAKDWNKAADTYQQALELSSSLAKPEEREEMAKHQAVAALRQELEEGKQAFTASEWQKAVDILQRSQKILADNPAIVSETEKLEINKLLINASVYQILSDAKKALTQQDLDGAVKGYNRAIATLRENEKVLGAAEVADGVGKIEKTVLMTRITEEQNQMVKDATSSADLGVNLKHYKTILALVEKSSSPDDAVLREVRDNAKSQIATLEKDILVNSKVEYLKENYEDIFRKNYPSSKSSTLAGPQVTFIKREGNILIFSMSCAERSQGRNFRLELNYQFDLDKKAWSLYSGKL